MRLNFHFNSAPVSRALSLILRSLPLASTLVLTLASAPEAAAQTAYEAPPDRWARSSFGLTSSSEYFMTSGNYDTTRGSYISLLNGNTFASLESHLRARYNWTPRVSVFGGSGFGTVKAVDGTTTKTSTNLTDLFVGADYMAWRKYVVLIPEVQLGFPMDHTDPSQTQPLTSDGVPYVRGGVFAHRWFKHVRVGGYLGAHIPLEALAGRFLYQFTVDWRLTQMFLIGADLDGYETLTSDSTSFLVRDGTALRADAGSERFYAYNPAMLEARAWIGVRLDRSFQAKLGYAKTLNGMDQANGQAITLFLAYTPPTGSHEADPLSLHPHKVAPEKALEGFSPDIESTEQGIFQEQEEETEGAVPPVAPPPQKSRAKPGDSLDQTEKMLEKKSQPSN